MFIFNPNEIFRPCKATLTVLTLTTISGCATNYDVPAIRIDSSLRVTPVGHRSLYGTTLGERYTVMHGYWLTSIDHEVQKAGQQPIRLLYLETNPGGILDRTVKTQKILQGDFGSLYSERQCSYREPLNQGASTVGVSLMSNEYSHETPGPFKSEPAKLPPLTSISVVRVLRSAPEYLVISANYEANGIIGSFSVAGAKNGDRSVEGNEGTSGNFQMQPQRLDELKRFGIPLQLDVDLYLRTLRIEFAPSALPEATSLAVVHYGFDEWIRVDDLHNGVAVSSKFLEPGVTEEEKVLNPICIARFKKQQAADISTVF